MRTIIRLGSPEDVSKFFYTDDPDLIFHLHQAGFIPMWRDEDCVYFKKTNKLIKLLKKLEIDIDVD